MRTRYKAMALGAAVVVCASAQITSKERMVEDRGQTRLERPGQWLDRGRLGSQPAVPLQAPWLTGVLVDASCTDRSAAHLRQAPPSLDSVVIGNPGAEQARGGGAAAAGVSVDPKTLEQEQSVAMPNHVPDLRGRQTDLSCGITAQTRLFAILTDDGRLLNLDQGGNTFALNAFQSTELGKAILEGRALAMKPRVRMQARVRGDQAVVEGLSMFQPHSRPGPT